MSIAHELHHDAPHDLVAEVRAIAERAKEASAELAQAPTAAKNRALTAGAAELRRRTEALLAANALDVKAAEAGGMTPAFIDRLSLTPARIEAMAAGLEAIAAFPDPVGATLAEWTRPNGLRIQRVRVPLGVVAVIFESRPNVTADAGALCLKAGNAAILRGGSDSLNSAKAIAAALHAGLSEAGLPEDAIQLVATRDRAAVGALLGLDDLIDVPRLRLMKLDVEGMEHSAISGAADLIARHRPILYVENDRREDSRDLIELIMSMGYRLYWHAPPLFNPDNYTGDDDNIFPGVISVNMVCIHHDEKVTVETLPEIVDPTCHPMDSQKNRG